MPTVRPGMTETVEIGTSTSVAAAKRGSEETSESAETAIAGRLTGVRPRALRECQMMSSR